MAFYIAVILAVIIIDYILLKCFFLKLSKMVAWKIDKVLKQSVADLCSAGDISKEAEIKIMQNFRSRLKTERVTKEDVLHVLGGHHEVI